MSSVFDNIFLPGTLTGETKNLLTKWFPSYLTGLEERLGLETGILAVPENYTSRNQFTSIPGEELPKVVVISPGIIGTPQKAGSGIYRATWRLGVGLAIAAKEEEDAIFLAELYGATVLAIIIDHPSINGVSSRTVWIDEQFNDLPTGTEHNHLRSAAVWFACDVDNVVSKTPGPPEPGTVAEIHTADEVKVEIDKLN